MEKLLGLKIDVDTYRGMRDGVPILLEIMGDLGIKGTFYLSIGPDASGRAILQLFRNPLFLKKMWRTNAVGLYGLETALYGLLLPSPRIALSFPNLVRRIIEEGHEVQFHAWDHRRWQDDLSRQSSLWIQEWFRKGVEGFTRLTERPPTSFGAPAWFIDDRVMQVVREYPFEYLSCTRAEAPFVHEDSLLMEIPSDLPCLEEVDYGRAIDMITDQLRRGAIHVLPLHAEVEGGIHKRYFEQLMRRISATDCRIVPLERIRKTLDPATLPVRRFQSRLIPGRSVPCAV